MLLSSRCLATVGYLGGLPSVYEKFMDSYVNMVQYNTEYVCGENEYIYYTRATQSEHAQARNSLVRQMRGEYLFQLDTDHLFEPDLFARMLRVMDTYQIDVLTGLYLFREPPHSPVLFKWREERERFMPIAEWPLNAEIFPVDSAGGGCLLVRRRVFECIVEELGEWPFDVTHPHLEDHSFYLRLLRLGIKAYCCPQIECYHLEMTPLMVEKHYDRTMVIPEEVVR